MVGQSLCPFTWEVAHLLPFKLVQLWMTILIQTSEDFLEIERYDTQLIKFLLQIFIKHEISPSKHLAQLNN